jgi:hypothetical protein
MFKRIESGNEYPLKVGCVAGDDNQVIPPCRTGDQ